MVWSDELVAAIPDLYPVSAGHTLFVPRRHVATWFDASPEEQRTIMLAVEAIKRRLDASARPPDGYNVGFNAGVAAGQTVMHLHVHLIPRYRGDMDDPAGGVRHVIPSKGDYRNYPEHPKYKDRARSLATGGAEDPFASHVLPLLLRARKVDILAAFVKMSGVARIQTALMKALEGGAVVHLLTGDYLNITDVEALRVLLDWQSRSYGRGSFEARVVEVGRLVGGKQAFHPKAWHLEGDGFGVAFVGSSNLSRSAFDTGIEWNLRVNRDRDEQAWSRIRAAFVRIWEPAQRLDAQWIDAYAERVRVCPPALPPDADPEDVPPPLAEPHEVQKEALACLQSAREQGRRRALVVLATGLGKTWLAVFDYARLWDELGRPPRLLFIVHRREILDQAARAFAALLYARGARVNIGRCVMKDAEVGAHLVFASVAKASRARWLDRLAAEKFDYVVVDEVHHAAAESYRRILARLDPLFLLGLTATPDRADEASILGLFDDHEAYRAELGRGIQIGRLVPFHYFGVRDDIDYDNIPWRDRRFDRDLLAAAAQTESRMQTLWTAWGARPGTRTLVFCCSIAHADFVAAWLSARGVRVAKIHSASSSDERDLALQRLGDGELDAICAIDVFNEGVDVPTLDRVVMLRPTASGIVFLQQLGRGLRFAPGKQSVTVIDFVGNHKVFLTRLRTLLSLGDRAPGLTKLIETGHVELPDGCSAQLELETKELLSTLFHVGGADAVERAYRELRVVRDRRPSAGELRRLGYLPSVLRARHGSWFGFVKQEGDLTPDELAALASGFLDDLETTDMKKSFKMVTLDVLLDAEALFDGLPIREIALRAWSRLQRSPELLPDVEEGHRLPADADEPAIRRWVAYWRSNPIDAWTKVKKGKRTWFVLDEDRLRLDLNPDPALPRLVRELVDYRLAHYRRPPATENSFVCRVTWNQRDPILGLPEGLRNKGDVRVRLPDGEIWTFGFMAKFCNTARPIGAPRNRLPDLLRRWFGPAAGHPGTGFRVQFTASPDGLWIEPLQVTAPVLDNVIGFPRRTITAYPDLRAAAGPALDEAAPPEQEVVRLPVEGDVTDRFAVRVSGNSMDGGSRPLHDGDWAILRYCRGLPASALVNRVVLVQLPGGGTWQLKRLVQRDGRWRLVSDNPDGPSFAASEDMLVVAQLERNISPDELAPPAGTWIADLEATFGIDAPSTGRWGGHLFVIIDAPGQLAARDRVRAAVPRRPGETAFVLAEMDGGWRYLGVGRWQEDGWRIPEVDAQTWERWG